MLTLISKIYGWVASIPVLPTDSGRDCSPAKYAVEDQSPAIPYSRANKVCRVPTQTFQNTIM